MYGLVMRCIHGGWVCDIKQTDYEVVYIRTCYWWYIRMYGLVIGVMYKLDMRCIYMVWLHGRYVRASYERYIRMYGLVMGGIYRCTG